MPRSLLRFLCQVEWENSELRGQLLGVTQERDSALRKSQGLQSKLESLEQVLKVRGLCAEGRALGSQATGTQGSLFLEFPIETVELGALALIQSCLAAHAGGGPAAAAAGGGT